MANLVTIRHVADPVEAEMFVDLLAQEGIVASVPGNQHNAVMGGLISSALRVPLKVPGHQAERAREVLAALEEYDEVDLEGAPPTAPDTSELEGGGPYRGGAIREDGSPPRKKRVAVAVGLFLPFVFGAFGAAHFYVRSYGRGFLLLATAWGFTILGLSGQSWAFFVPAFVIIADIVGSLGVITTRRSAHTAP